MSSDPPALSGARPPLPPELAGLDPTASDFPQQAAAQIMAAMDTNGDGVISGTESKLPADVFARLSTDGQITMASLVADFKAMQSAAPPADAPKPPADAPTPPADLAGLDPKSADFAKQLASRIFASMDANGDGIISADESKLPADVFARLSGSGAVTLDALVADIQAQQARFDAAMKPGAGAPAMPGRPGALGLTSTLAGGSSAGPDPVPAWSAVSLAPVLGLQAAAGQLADLDLLGKNQGILAQG